uniref:Uncharacterized protein n=1 Tax=Tetranychus urticae TaxID=32264 RepID=T1KQU0_TETUR
MADWTRNFFRLRPNLLDEMISHLQSCGGDFCIINDTLQTAHSLLKDIFMNLNLKSLG